MKLDEIITGFKKIGRYSSAPLATTEQIADWEGQLNFEFPADYKRILTSGAFDGTSFRCIEPQRDEAREEMIVFAEWNYDRFAFREDDPTHGVYVLVPGMKPEMQYKNFTDWFGFVYKTAEEPTFPE